MSKDYDVIVIGGGPAGYPCAIRAAQNGKKVACVDDWKNHDGSEAFGGTCLNAGCIPSKALLESSEMFHKAQHELSRHGVKLPKVELDLDTMQERRAGIVKKLTGGIGQLLKANKVDGIRGRGRFIGGGKVEVDGSDGEKKTLTAEHVVLAVGSVPVELSKIAPFDGERIVDSWGALEFDAVPKRLGVIGAGVIGLELGSVWSRLGSETVLIEAMDEFLAAADRQIAKEGERTFRKQGLDIRLGAKLTKAEAMKTKVKVTYEDKDGEHTEDFDKLIVAVGRRPNTEGCLGDKSGVKLDDRGFIEVDEECRTKVKNVWAVGDCVRGPMLAHKGTEEGVMVADLIAGKVGEVNYEAVPNIIYTHPEIAWVGKTEEEVKEAGTEYKTGSFSFAPNGRALAMEAGGGTAKFVSDAKDDTILGVHIIGPMASELIAEAVLAMEYQASTEDIQRTMHGHPTLSEVLHEAALAVDGMALHGVNKKR